MPTFRSPHNPKFKLRSSRLPQPIEFADGVFRTDDPDEIRVLRRQVKAGTLLEVSIDESRDAYVAGEKTHSEFEADVTDVLRSEAAAHVADDDEYAGVSRSDLVEYAREGLSLNIPRGASRKSVLDAIRNAEQEAADSDEDFDPNDPDGS